MFLLLFYWSCPRVRPLFFFWKILPQKKTWTGWSRFCFFSAKWGVKPTDFFENLIFGLEIKSFPLLVFTWSQGFKKQARPPPAVTLKGLWVIRGRDPHSGEGKKQKLSPDKRRRRSKGKHSTSKTLDKHMSTNRTRNWNPNFLFQGVVRYTAANTGPRLPPDAPRPWPADSAT